MDFVLFSAKERGVGNYGRLQANYSFSFASYYDPDKMWFGLLRVLNDDTIAGGAWFPTHGHDNMEIITIPQSGALEHQDSTGGHGVVHVGDVQVMSAGSGVEHSEYNASETEPATLFQLWIDTKEKNIAPRYDQKSFGTLSESEMRLLVSNDGRQSSLMIHQDAFVSRATIRTGDTQRYVPCISTNGVYMMVVSGRVVVWDHVLGAKDAIGVTAIDVSGFGVKAEERSDVLFVEVPMG